MALLFIVREFSRLEAERSSRSGWIEQKIKRVGRANDAQVAILESIESATLTIVDGDREPPGFLYQMQHEPIVIAVAEGGDVLGIELHHILQFREIVTPFPELVRSHNARKLVLGRSERISGYNVKIHEFRQLDEALADPADERPAAREGAGVIAHDRSDVSGSESWDRDRDTRFCFHAGGIITDSAAERQPHRR